MVDTSSLSIWDLSNNCVVSRASYDDFTNSDITNNEITDEDAWNILKMEEILDWRLSYEPQTQSPIPIFQETHVQTDDFPPSEIFSDSEMDSCIESSQKISTKNCDDMKWIEPKNFKNLPKKPRLNSVSIDSDSELSGAESNSDSSNEIEWIPKTKLPKKNRLNSKKSKDRKPNVSHWLWELLQNRKNHKMIAFTDEKQGEFRILDQKAIADLWGSRNGKKNLKMNYKDLARTMRYHYKKSKGQELQAVNKHLVYRFSRHFLNARRNEVV